MTDVFLVTAESHPTLFKAFETISHDCGRQAGHTNYAVPLLWQGVIAEIEHDLSVMDEADFETLCIGEEVERQQLVQRDRLRVVDKLLQEFFEEFS